MSSRAGKLPLRAAHTPTLYLYPPWCLKMDIYAFSIFRANAPSLSAAWLQRITLAPPRYSSSTWLASSGASRLGLDPKPLQRPHPHLQACVPQGGVEGTKGQASLSCEPRGSLYRTAAKAQRGWVAWARSHSIPSKPGLPSPGRMTPASPRKVAALGCLSRPPNLSLHPLLEVCLILALIFPRFHSVSLRLSGCHQLGLSLSGISL